MLIYRCWFFGVSRNVCRHAGIFRIQSENGKRHAFRLLVDRFRVLYHVLHHVSSGVALKGENHVKNSHKTRTGCGRKESEVIRQVAVVRPHERRRFTRFGHEKPALGQNIPNVGVSETQHEEETVLMLVEAEAMPLPHDNVSL